MLLLKEGIFSSREGNFRRKEGVANSVTSLRPVLFRGHKKGKGAAAEGEGEKEKLCLKGKRDSDGLNLERGSLS